MRSGQIWALPVPEVVGIVATIIVLTVGLGLFSGFDLLGATQSGQAKNQFDAFTTEIEDTCRAIGNTGDLQPLGNTAYNFSQIIHITLTDTTLIAEGDGFTHRTTIQECGSLQFCEAGSTENCDITRLQAGKSMRFEYYKGSAQAIKILPRTEEQESGVCGGEPPSGITGGCNALGRSQCQAAPSCSWAGSPGTAAGGCWPANGGGNVCEDVNDFDNPRETCIEIGCDWSTGG